MVRLANYLSGLTPTNILPQYNNEKPQIRNILQNTRSVLLKIVKVIKNKEVKWILTANMSLIRFDEWMFILNGILEQFKKKVKPEKIWIKYELV